MLQSVARLKDEFLRTKLQGGSSPDVSTLSLPHERLSTASQTDLSGEVMYTHLVILQIKSKLSLMKSCHQKLGIVDVLSLG